LEASAAAHVALSVTGVQVAGTHAVAWHLPESWLQNGVVVPEPLPLHVVSELQRQNVAVELITEAHTGVLAGQPFGTSEALHVS